MKLSKTQIKHLETLSKQIGPMTYEGLAKKEGKGVRTPTLDSLVNLKLARIRKTAGRTDRIEILAAGKAALKNTL